MIFLPYHYMGLSLEEDGNLVNLTILLLSHLSITMLKLLLGIKRGMRKD